MPLFLPDTGWRPLAHSAVQAAHTGDTNETTKATIVVPGNSMGANGMLRIWTHWSYTNSANNKTMRWKFGGTTFVTSVTTTTASYTDLRNLWNRNAANAQLCHTGTISGIGATSTALTTGTIDTTTDQNLLLTVQLANSGETINLEAYLVEILYRP